jgi:hypothetical protein
MWRSIQGWIQKNERALADAPVMFRVFYGTTICAAIKLWYQLPEATRRYNASVKSK